MKVADSAENSRPGWVVLATILLLSAACSSSGLVGKPGAVNQTAARPAADGTTAVTRPSLPPAPEPASPVWSPCTEVGVGVECATVRVPLDYEHPADEQISIAVSRIKADPTQRIGVLLFNPGGPGVSGLDLPESILGSASGTKGPASPLDQSGVSISTGPPDSGADLAMLRRFDLIGFDPRGVGKSTPVTCGDLVGIDSADYRPVDEQGKKALIATMRSFGEACRQRSGRLLGFVDTMSAARDIDQIRRALGEQTVNLFGFSYGTMLFATYADLFPARVRAAVLDGAELPQTDGVGLIQDQAVQLEKLFTAFLASCSKRPDCAFYSGGDPVKAFDDLRAALRAKPMQVGANMLTEGEATTVVASAMYAKRYQALMEAGLDRARKGDASLAVIGWDLYIERRDGVRENLTEATAVINCLDFSWPVGDAGYDSLVTKTEALAPRMGAAFLREVLPCAYWPIPPRPRSVPVAEGAPPILVVGTTGDPATPYPWAQALAKQLKSGFLLTREGEGHTAWRESRCTDEAIDAYLVSLTVPAPNTICPTP